MKGETGRSQRKGLLFIFTGALIFALDQATKFLIRATMSPGQSYPEDGLVRLTYITNTGAAFGILTDQSLFLLFATLIGVGAILFYYLFPPANNLLLTMSLGFQLGGALGNLVDRLRFGYVTDFLDFRVWPVFNLADSFIVVGVSILIGYLFLSKEETPVGARKPPSR